VAVAVRSEFADGTQVVTGATRGDPSTLPRNPAIDSLGFSWVRDPRVLCEIHRRRLGHLGFGNRPRVAPPPGAELSYMDAERERDFAFWERVGYYHRHEAAGAMRLTWKGAFLSAWKMTEPVKSWRIWLRDGKACRAWRKLGMDGWRPPAVRAAPTPATLGPPQHDGDHSAQPDGRE
jgi:hypothetical protein